MFPIRDHNPSRRTPYVTWALIAVNVVVFALYWPLFSDEMRLAAFFQDWALIPREITSGQDFHTVLTSMFLHGGFMHLAGNMLFLWIFGDNMEDAFGHFPFLLFYVLCGIGADLIQVLSSPYSPVPTVGASGAIAGVLGGYLLLYPKAKVDVILIIIVFFKIFSIRAWIVLGIWFALQIFGSLSSVGSTGGGVAYWAHAGGFVIGVLLTLPYWLRKGGRYFWSQTEGHPPHAETKFPERITPIPVVRRRRR
ncbi:MAG: rhomboid family intramembrane serine protease [Rhodobacteraceae bacterium]|nr:rhomboid family intramembrane serine protease [Paracoccaceae bacterium]